ncbi:sensor histidine kinase [Sulfurimonas sp.]|uniref:sensor histidine kinase n=1 Tax=Sulfurimonas sp. TaxID=2022749 RepID=UPI00356B37EC
MNICAFKDAKMQKKFDRWREPLQLKQIYVISILTASLYIIMSFADRVIAPKETMSLMVFVHLWAVPSVLLVISLLTYLKKYKIFMINLLIVAPLIAAIGNIIIVSNFHGYSIYSNEIYLIVFWIFTVSGLKLIQGLISALLVVVMSVTCSYLFYNLQTNEFIMHLFWLFASMTFGFFGKYLLELSNKSIFIKHEQLSLELNNKNVLLRELFHRVKNNLQIISSILSLQSKKIEDKSAKEVFQNSIQTIISMGIIHEKLYKSDNLEAVNISDYVYSLISYMKQNLGGSDIKFNVECDDMMITLDNAIPIGLVINELLTNSIKYAFNEDSKNKTIDIKMNLDNEKLILEVSDNGVGIDFDNLIKGFGFKLIDSLVVYQLKGSLEYFNRNGLCYILKFNENVLAK